MAHSRSNTLLSSVLTQPTKRRRANFILKFSPDEILATVVRLEENIATVLDLRSGGPLLAVGAGMEVLDLRTTGSTTVILGTGGVATLNLGARARALNARVKINHSVKTIRINRSGDRLHGLGVPLVSISPDLSRIAITEYSQVERSEVLNVYDVCTGKLLTGTATGGCMPWFTPNGREVWCLEDRTAKGWTIIEDRESDLTRLEPLGPTTDPSGGPPWRSPRGYKVMDNGWVLSPSGKRSLWLPHHWMLDEEYRTWGGRFLDLLHYDLPEVVILELDE